MGTKKISRAKPLQARQSSACETKGPVPAEAPEAGLHVADANVYSDGSCAMPAHAESAREDTGEPCVDGRNWPETKPNNKKK